MTEPTPLYRNLVLEHALSAGVPPEVKEEAVRHAEEVERHGDDFEAFSLADLDAAVAYAYGAGRMARWDALVKASPKLYDGILRGVHEFFHDEPFGQHDGVAVECTDCPTVAALAADLAAAYYRALPGNPDIYVEDDETEADLDAAMATGDPVQIVTDPLPTMQVPTVRALHASVPNEWRPVKEPRPLYDSTDAA